MSSETWEWTYITIQYNGHRHTLKCLHYKDNDPARDREWYRIYPQDFDKGRIVADQVFGFGTTWEAAFKRYFATLELHARGA